MRYCHLILFFLAVFLCVQPVHARSQAEIRAINETLKRARALEDSGKVEAALRVYREVYGQHPRRVDILYRLEAALSREGRHDEAIALLDAHLQQSPRDVTARLRLGDALYTQGKQEQAFAQWERILEGASNAGFYALVADRYRKRNLIARAAGAYRAGRTALGTPRLFAKELAELAERQADYPEAVREYFLFLRDKPQYRTLVESRLREFARDSTQQQPILFLLEQAVRDHPGEEIPLWLLIEFALPAGQAEAALRVLVDGPGRDRDRRVHLLRIASYCLKEAVYPVAAEAYRALLGVSEGSDLQARALLGLARAQEGRNLDDEARRLYRDLVGRYSRRPEADEARYRLGRLLHRVDGNSDAALRAFRSLVETGRRTPWRYRALFEIAEIQLRADRFDASEAACLRIIRERPGTEEADRAHLRMAELRFLSEDFAGARELLAPLLSGKMDRYAFNDALALSVLIQKGQQDAPDALRAYAAAQKFRRRGERERALETLEGLMERPPGSVFSDRVLAARAELLEELARYPEAIQTCRRLLADVPWSPLCPWAQMALARIYDERLGQYYEARQAYEAVLTDHPESLEADTARERLRALREKIREIEAGEKEAG